MAHHMTIKAADRVIHQQKEIIAKLKRMGAHFDMTRAIQIAEETLEMMRASRERKLLV